MNKRTSLALRGVDAGSDASVLFRFAAGGAEFEWRFKAATFDELVALALGGRLGVGKDVHFDAAKVTYTEGRSGRPGVVRIAIGRKVRIIAPVQGKAAVKAVVRAKKAADAPVKRTAAKKAVVMKKPAAKRAPVKRTAVKRAAVARKTPIA